jgi:hypothetical protein
VGGEEEKKNQCCRSRRLGPTSRSAVLCRRDSKGSRSIRRFQSRSVKIGASRTKSDLVAEIVHSLLLSLTSEHCASLLHRLSSIVVVARHPQSSDRRPSLPIVADRPCPSLRPSPIVPILHFFTSFRQLLPSIGFISSLYFLFFFQQSMKLEK